jgi:putative ABC transport system permease protein
MKIEDMLEISLTSIKHRRLRSWLTILGIVIGVASIISLLSVSLGMQQQINERTSSLGANIISITPGSSKAMRIPGQGMMGGGPPGRGAFGGEEADEKITFREADILSTMPGVYRLDTQIQERLEVSYKNENSSLSVIGTDPSAFKDVEQAEIDEGRYLNTNDKYSVVVGYNVPERVFGEEDLLNKQIEIDGVVFRVVGILQQYGTSDSNLYIPVETAKSLFDQYDEIDTIKVSVREGHDLDEVAEDLEQELLSLHNLEGDDPDFTVTTPTSLQSAVSSISDTLGLFLGGIASISLVVGGIGVLNTMFMSVLEQTKIIGVFKALGAKDREIVLLFLFEAAILGFVGGFAGVLLSIFASMAMESFSVPTLITLDLVALGLIFSVAVGIVAGIAPARNAASISPVEALRYE